MPLYVVGRDVGTLEFLEIVIADDESEACELCHRGSREDELLFAFEVKATNFFTKVTRTEQSMPYP